MANILTHVGKRIITARLLSNTLPADPNHGHAPPIHIGWGSGVTANNGSGNNGIPANVVDTALAGEETEGRTAGSPSQQTTTATNDTFQVQGTITAVAGKTITNAGLFDKTKAQGGSVAVGNLFAKGDFTGVALNSGDSIAFTFKWQLQ